MGKCIYCGLGAGLFSSKHKKCEEVFYSGQYNIADAVYQSIVNTKRLGDLQTSITEVASNSFIDEGLKRNLLIKGFDQAVDKFLEDGLISNDEEESVKQFMELTGLTILDLNVNNSVNKLVQGSIINSLYNGVIPERRVTIIGDLPFNFAKNEKLIWLYPEANYFEMKTKTRYEGRSSGVSIRIAKGLYYRTGQFKGTPVSTSEMTLISKGKLAFTDQNIYFSSPAKGFKIPYKKIISVEPYTDGIGIQEDRANAKPKSFGNLNGWFVYNLVKCLTANLGN